MKIIGRIGLLFFISGWMVIIVTLLKPEVVGNGCGIIGMLIMLLGASLFIVGGE